MRVETDSMPSNEVGSVDMFLKVTGSRQGLIKGESKDAAHREEIEIESFSYEVTQPYSVSGGGVGVGKRQHAPFRFRMRAQSASPKLFKAATTGEHLKEVVLTCRKAGGKQHEYLKWIFRTAFVVHYKTGCGAEGEIVPTDEIALSFQEITIEYREQTAQGSLGGVVAAQDSWKLQS